MKIIYCTSLLLILLLSACSLDKNAYPADDEGQGNVTFLFKTAPVRGTRTVLNSSDDLQHVEKVYLYVFKGTDDAAICVDIREIPWPVPGDIDYQTFIHTYSIELTPGGYTFLAVGLDDRAGATYNLPQAIANGTILSAAKATLAGGNTKDDISRSELFAGNAVAANVQVSGNPVVNIDLRRRVAGVIAWFRNIPYKLPDLNSGTVVAKMTVELYTAPNKTIELRKAVTDDYGENPFGDNENGMNNKIILEFDLTGYIKMTEKNYYDVTATDAGNLLQAGAYLLPVKIPDVANVPTLTLRYYDTAGVEITGTSRSIKLVSSTQEGVVTDINTTTFSIEANQLYCLGSKTSAIDLDPWIGNELVITIDPAWEGIGEEIPLE